MATVTIRLHGPAQGETRDIQGRPGQSLMEAAVKAGIEGIEADCGGMLTCATCHVYVREPFASRLELPAEDETGMLEFTASPRRDNSRLSCQIKLEPALDGIEVDLPPAQH